MPLIQVANSVSDVPTLVCLHQDLAKFLSDAQKHANNVTTTPVEIKTWLPLITVALIANVHCINKRVIPHSLVSNYIRI